MTDDRRRLDEWSARWIEPVEPDGVPELQRPAHGRIQVAWEVTGDRGRIDVTVPAGTEAKLLLPDGTEDTLAAGIHRRTWATA